MTPEPVVALSGDDTVAAPRIAARGASFVIHEWRGSGPAALHVHHRDDEAWHVLEGRLRFRFAGEEVNAPAGSTVFVPAGVAHTFAAVDDSTRYLIVLTPVLDHLIAELQRIPDRAAHAAVYLKHASELLEPAS
jgi:mannose-6-phosphate isomerase-like protein (cupin superfamily)